MHMLRVAALSCVAVVGAAHAGCLKGNAGIPPGANTTDPSAPFYIDTSGLDFKTAPPTRDPKNPELSAGDRASRRNAPAKQGRRQFHHRAHACACA